MTMSAEELVRRYKAGEYKGMSPEKIAAEIGWANPHFVETWIKRADCEHDYSRTGMTSPAGGDYYSYRECRKCGDVTDIATN